jgi:uncharacterized protein (TIGR03435 family)
MFTRASVAASVTLALLIGFAEGITSRVAGAGAPTFSAATVRVSESGAIGVWIRASQVTFHAENALFLDLVRYAYGVPSFQIVGVPPSLTAIRFDIDATILPNGRGREVPAMLQSLLAERFALAATAETWQMPVHALRLTGINPRYGPHLSRSPLDCSRVNVRLSPMEPLVSSRPICGIAVSPLRMRAAGVTMSQFANALASVLGKPVVDETGLEGFFDLDVFSAYGDIASALREQLGLMLLAKDGTATVLVIQFARPPS